MAKMVSICTLTETHNCISRTMTGAALFKPSHLPLWPPPPPCLLTACCPSPGPSGKWGAGGADWFAGKLVVSYFKPPANSVWFWIIVKKECLFSLTQVTHLALLLGRADSWTNGSSTGARLSLGGSDFGLLYSAVSRFFIFWPLAVLTLLLKLGLRLTSILKCVVGVPGTCPGSQD